MAETMQLFAVPGAPEPLMRGGAVLSEDRLHRYSLWRRWADDGPPVTFVMLNPSTADASVDDPTIRKCVGFAKRWGHGAIEVVNLFAYRSTDPKAMYAARNRGVEIIGRDNDAHIERAFRCSARIIAAWGANPTFLRPSAVWCIAVGAGRRLEALRVTKGGAPGHPLYIPYTAEPVPFEVRP